MPGVSLCLGLSSQKQPPNVLILPLVEIWLEKMWKHCIMIYTSPSDGLYIQWHCAYLIGSTRLQDRLNHLGLISLSPLFSDDIQAALFERDLAFQAMEKLPNAWIGPVLPSTKESCQYLYYRNAMAAKDQIGRKCSMCATAKYMLFMWIFVQIKIRSTHV